MSTPSAIPFDHERLDVYAAALDFISLTHDIVARFPKGRSSLADQLERAATSIALNIAEGCGEYSPKEKSRFYRMALRSAAERAAVLDVASRFHAATPTHARNGKDLCTGSRRCSSPSCAPHDK